MTDRIAQPTAAVLRSLRSGDPMAGHSTRALRRLERYLTDMLTACAVALDGAHDEDAMQRATLAMQATPDDTRRTVLTNGAVDFLLGGPEGRAAGVTAIVTPVQADIKVAFGLAFVLSAVREELEQRA